MPTTVQVERMGQCLVKFLDLMFCVMNVVSKAPILMPRLAIRTSGMAIDECIYTDMTKMDGRILFVGAMPLLDCTSFVAIWHHTTCHQCDECATPKTIACLIDGRVVVQHCRKARHLFFFSGCPCFLFCDFASALVCPKNCARLGMALQICYCSAFVQQKSCKPFYHRMPS